MRRFVLAFGGVGFVWQFYARNLRDTGLLGEGACSVWRKRLLPPRLDTLAAKRPVWLHAAGPGDVRAAVPFVAALREMRPAFPILVTTGAVAARNLAEKLLYDSVEAVAWLPFDTPFTMAASVRRWNPRLFIGMQGEFWPNLILQLKKRSIPMAFLRVDMLNWQTQQEFPGWVRPYYEEMIREVDYFSVRAEMYKRRLVESGVAPDRICIGGDYRLASMPTPDPEMSDRYRKLLRAEEGPPWVVLASPRLDEIRGIAAELADDIRAGRLRLLIAPVSLDVGRAALKVVQRIGLPVAVRSALDEGVPPPPVVLLDTQGELFHIFAAASVAFIGDTLPPSPSIGANPWEPLLQGCRLVHGPEMADLEEFGEACGETHINRADSFGSLGEVTRQLLAIDERKASINERGLNAGRKADSAGRTDVHFLLEWLDGG